MRFGSFKFWLFIFIYKALVKLRLTEPKRFIIVVDARKLVGENRGINND